MKDPTGYNDPLNPIYPHDPGKVQPVKRIGALGSRTNLAVLIVIAVAILGIVLLLEQEKTAPETPAPSATEIK